MNVKSFCSLGHLKQLKSRIDKMKNRTENVFYVWWAMKLKNSDNFKTLKTSAKIQNNCYGEHIKYRYAKGCQKHSYEMSKGELS